MFPLLGLLSNPLTKIVADKVIGGISHNMEKKKIIRAAEIEASKAIDVAKLTTAMELQKSQVVASTSSWKDEWITLVFTCLLIAHFLPWTSGYMIDGWETLKNAPELFWYIMLAIVSGSFGLNAMGKFKK
tara:strand:- start:876 stop:1265 length:390 start_codon:yes stop_codon:yes gene_type:complete